jgi:hypothetical protein
MVSLARRRFSAFKSQGRTQRVLRALLGRERRLLCLEQATAGRTVRGAYSGGLKAVALDAIIGSEGRARDFDGDWHPLKESNRGRWMSISMARETHTPLPPVTLIALDGKYFVRDGHHRISVARSLGNEFIEAEITIWQMTDAPCCAVAPVGGGLTPAFS